MLKESSNEEETFNIERVDEEIALLGFISDYLRKRGLNSTAEELTRESSCNLKSKMLPELEMERLISSVNEMRGTSVGQPGVLAEWWKVFWTILKDKTTKNIPKDVAVSSENNLPRKPFKDFTRSKIIKITSSNPTSVKIKKAQQQVVKVIQVPPLPSPMLLNMDPPYTTDNQTLHLSTLPPTLHVIDQVNRPVDSKQLLMLRQSLYQEYLKKHSNQQRFHNTGYFHNTMVLNDLNTTNDLYNNNTEPTSTEYYPDSTLNTTQLPTEEFNYSCSELNFNEFMNDYLI